MIPIKACRPGHARHGQPVTPEDIVDLDPEKAPKATRLSAFLVGCGSLVSFGVAATEAFLAFCVGRWGSPVNVKEPTASPVEKAAPYPEDD